MAKRRNKNKAKRRLACMDRKLKINGEIVEIMLKKDTHINSMALHLSEDTDGGDVDLGGKVQITENGILTSIVAENESNILGTKEAGQDAKLKPKIRMANNKTKKQLNKCTSGDETTDDVLIYPTEVNGETCIDITCGSNDAQLYLTKLRLGSKGACILFSDSWYTPNEFQTVSGRETAKDWKRSIRHKGRSLKMLISKGLITVQNILPGNLKADKKVPAGEAPSPTLVENTPSGEKTDIRDNGDGNISKVERTITPDTKPAETKPRRGRKPKKLRQKNRQKEVVSKTKTKCNQSSRSIWEVDTPGLTNGDDTKTQSKEDNDTVSQLVVDNRTEEERRLEEFVTSLRLTKTTAPRMTPDLTPAPSFSHVTEPLSYPEMPVLQKEADIDPVSPTTHKDERVEIDVSVDTAFHATVTPPPTPPGDKTEVLPETNNAQLMETFKSRLASPSNGLKLTINREKIQPVHYDVPQPISNDALCDNVKQNVSASNLQSMLLQDALKSAKRYKEQLKQTPKTVSVKPIIQVPKLTPKDNHVEVQKVAPVVVSTLDGQMHKEDDKVQKPLKQSTINTHYNHFQEIHRSQTAHSSAHSSQQTGYGFINNTPSMFDRRNLAEMSFQDFLAVLSSIYGPLPFPVETRDAAFAAVQEMHRRHDMLRFIAQSQLEPSSPALLYPMMTQQILLAMTQQLYSTCNKPGWSPDRMSDKVNLNIDQSNLQNFENSKARQGVVNAHGTSCEQNLDIQSKKRKHVKEEHDGALDLSVKKQRTESACVYKQPNPAPDSFDAPLDFSMKKTQYPNKCYNTNNSPNMTESIRTDRSPWPGQQTPTPKSRTPHCRCGKGGDGDVTQWSVDRVCSFLRNLDGCAQYAKTFHDQGISGRLLPYLTTQHLTRTLGMKVGPALTLMQAVDKKLKDTRTPSSGVCFECKLPQLPAVAAHT